MRGIKGYWLPALQDWLNPERFRPLRCFILSRRLAVCAAVLLVFGGGATIVRGQGQPPMTASASLNFEQQVQALEADKAQWTSAQEKLDSQLIFAAKFKKTGVVNPAALTLRPSLTNEADGRIKVDIKCTVTPELLAAIEAAGGTIISSSPRYQFLRAVLPVENLETIAGRADVIFIQPIRKARRNAVDSEGDTTHQAIQARASYPAAGAGIKVGVLSDSIDNGSGALAAAEAGGNIVASNLFVLPGQQGTGEAEGLAMCEIVHDLAPQATIYFATGAASEQQMASNIVALAQAGCRIICDDEAYPDESPFEDAVIAQAVNTVSAMGVSYFSCARNSGNLDAGTSSTWQGDFVTSNTVAGYGPELLFGTGSGATRYDAILTGGSDFEANLFWTDPLGAATNDYDLFLFNLYSGNIIYSSQNRQNGTQDPYEHIDNPAGYNSGYALAVIQYSGTNRFLHLDFGRGVLNWATGGCIRGHNACDAPNAYTVAATPAATAYSGNYIAGPYLNGTGTTGPYPAAFNSSDIVEYFSADGPRRMYFNPDGTAVTPGNFSSAGGKMILKPEFTAADGVTCTPPGFAPFFGTSAATPHAAAIAAMVLSYNPSLTPAQLRTVLTNSCIDIMATGWDRDSGYGILMASTALQKTPPPNYFVAGSGKYFSTGQFQVALGGVVNSNYDILVSTNLTAWSTLATLKMTNVTSIFNDTHASAGRRFYRSKLAP